MRDRKEDFHYAQSAPVSSIDRTRSRYVPPPRRTMPRWLFRTIVYAVVICSVLLVSHVFPWGFAPHVDIASPTTTVDQRSPR